MIYDISPINRYSGNNSSVQFDFDFYIENSNQLNVYHFNGNGEKHKLVHNVDYTIHEIKNPNGSYIVFPIENSKYGILKENEELSLELTLPISQETAYNNSSLLNLEALEYSFDYLTRLIQILSRRLDGCIEVSDYTSSDITNLIQEVTNCASKAQTAYENIQECGIEPATTTTRGVVRIGNGINVDFEGLISVEEGANKDINNLSASGNSRLQFAPFAINQGTVLNGENNTLTYSDSIITCAPCTITTTDGRTLEDTDSAAYDITDEADGDYCILKDYSTGELSLADNIYIGKNAFEYINLTDEGTAIASGTASGYSLANAFDNNISTRWASSQKGAAVPNAAYIGRSGLSKPIKKIMLYQGLEGYTTNYCDEIKIQYSDDGTTWNDIQTVTNCLNNEWQEIIVDDYTPADTTHSIRLLAYSSPAITGNSAWAVDELELYAKNVFNNRLDISTVPANLYLDGILNNNLVYIGDCTISSGSVTAIKNNRFNMNGYWELFNLPDYSSKISLTSGTLYTAETNGWILNGNTIIQTLYKGDSYTPSANGYYFARMRGY